MRLGDKTRELFQVIDRNPPKRLVVDMRQNGGGDFFVGRRHLVNPVKNRPVLNQKGRLFVIVGRRTFSAAMVNAIDFRKETNALLVGEPIGERPNSYSENDEMTLTNSRIVVSYSARVRVRAASASGPARTARSMIAVADTRRRFRAPACDVPR